MHKHLRAWIRKITNKDTPSGSKVMDSSSPLPVFQSTFKPCPCQESTLELKKPRHRIRATHGQGCGQGIKFITLEEAISIEIRDQESLSRWRHGSSQVWSMTLHWSASILKLWCAFGTTFIYIYFIPSQIWQGFVPCPPLGLRFLDQL